MIETKAMNAEPIYYRIGFRFWILGCMLAWSCIGTGLVLGSDDAPHTKTQTDASGRAIEETVVMNVGPRSMVYVWTFQYDENGARQTIRQNIKESKHGQLQSETVTERRPDTGVITITQMDSQGNILFEQPIPGMASVPGPETMSSLSAKSSSSDAIAPPHMPTMEFGGPYYVRANSDSPLVPHEPLIPEIINPDGSTTTITPGTRLVDTIDPVTGQRVIKAVSDDSPTGLPAQEFDNLTGEGTLQGAPQGSGSLEMRPPDPGELSARPKEGASGVSPPQVDMSQNPLAGPAVGMGPPSDPPADDTGPSPIRTDFLGPETRRADEDPVDLELDEIIVGDGLPEKLIQEDKARQRDRQRAQEGKPATTSEPDKPQGDAASGSLQTPSFRIGNSSSSAGLTEGPSGEYSATFTPPIMEAVDTVELRVRVSAVDARPNKVTLGGTSAPDVSRVVGLNPTQGHPVVTVLPEPTPLCPTEIPDPLLGGGLSSPLVLIDVIPGRGRLPNKTTTFSDPSWTGSDVGGVVQVDKDLDGDGDYEHTERTYPDGRREVQDTRILEDGSVETRKEVTYPDGSKETSVTRTSPRGSTSETERTWPDGRRQTESVRETGTKKERTTRTDYPDGRTEVSTEKTVKKGSETHTDTSTETKYPDGRTTRTSVSAHGERTEETTYPDGSSASRREVSLPGGGTRTTTTDPDGRTQTVERQPSGNEITETVHPDGTVERTTRTASGTERHESTSPDGTTVRTERGGDGSVVRTTTYPDGRTETVIDHSDGRGRSVIRTAPDGSSTSSHIPSISDRSDDSPSGADTADADTGFDPLDENGKLPELLVPRQVGVGVPAPPTIVSPVADTAPVDFYWDVKGQVMFSMHSGNGNIARVEEVSSQSEGHAPNGVAATAPEVQDPEPRFFTEHRSKILLDWFNLKLGKPIQNPAIRARLNGATTWTVELLNPEAGRVDLADDDARLLYAFRQTSKIAALMLADDVSSALAEEGMRTDERAPIDADVAVAELDSLGVRNTVGEIYGDTYLENQLRSLEQENWAIAKPLLDRFLHSDDTEISKDAPSAMFEGLLFSGKIGRKVLTIVDQSQPTPDESESQQVSGGAPTSEAEPTRRLTEDSEDDDTPAPLASQDPLANEPEMVRWNHRLDQIARFFDTSEPNSTINILNRSTPGGAWYANASLSAKLLPREKAIIEEHITLFREFKRTEGSLKADGASTRVLLALKAEYAKRANDLQIHIAQMLEDNGRTYEVNVAALKFNGKLLQLEWEQADAWVRFDAQGHEGPALRDLQAKILEATYSVRRTALYLSNEDPPRDQTKQTLAVAKHALEISEKREAVYREQKGINDKYTAKIAAKRELMQQFQAAHNEASGTFMYIVRKAMARVNADIQVLEAQQRLHTAQASLKLATFEDDTFNIARANSAIRSAQSNIQSIQASLKTTLENISNIERVDQAAQRNRQQKGQIDLRTASQEKNIKENISTLQESLQKKIAADDLSSSQELRTRIAKERAALKELPLMAERAKADEDRRMYSSLGNSEKANEKFRLVKEIEDEIQEIKARMQEAINAIREGPEITHPVLDYARSLEKVDDRAQVANGLRNLFNKIKDKPYDFIIKATQILVEEGHRRGPSELLARARAMVIPFGGMRNVEQMSASDLTEKMSKLKAIANLYAQFDTQGEAGVLREIAYYHHWNTTGQKPPDGWQPSEGASAPVLGPADPASPDLGRKPLPVDDPPTLRPIDPVIKPVVDPVLTIGMGSGPPASSEDGSPEFMDDNANSFYGPLPGGGMPVLMPTDPVIRPAVDPVIGDNGREGIEALARLRRLDMGMQVDIQGPEDKPTGYTQKNAAGEVMKRSQIIYSNSGSPASYVDELTDAQGNVLRTEYTTGLASDSAGNEVSWQRLVRQKDPASGLESSTLTVVKDGKVQSAIMKYQKFSTGGEVLNVERSGMVFGDQKDSQGNPLPTDYAELITDQQGREVGTVNRTGIEYDGNGQPTVYEEMVRQRDPETGNETRTLSTVEGGQETSRATTYHDESGREIGNKPPSSGDIREQKDQAALETLRQINQSSSQSTASPGQMKKIAHKVFKEGMARLAEQFAKIDRMREQSAKQIEQNQALQQRRPQEGQEHRKEEESAAHAPNGRAGHR